MYRAQLHWQPIAALLLLALTWGANMAVVKLAYGEMAPLFMCGLRSLVASVCLYLWIRARGIKIFPSTHIVLHGVVIGFLFGLEFGLIYFGLQFTFASRTYVLLYTAPFFVAIGAHLLLKGDRLNPWKVAGLVLAFTGVLALFINDLGTFSMKTLPGDILALVGGAVWGFTTIYLKKFLAERTVPLQTLFYQVFFSTPFLLLASFALEGPYISGFSLMGAFSLFYQCIIVAFLSYLIWFDLIHRYPVSLLHAFSFFTPVLGVFLSGSLILGEPIRMGLIFALILVSLGMVLVNRQPNPSS
jgi:drug/metabolite transporter (DMT)-like permease